MKRLGLLVFCMVFGAFSAQAGTVNLTFDAPPSGAQVEKGFGFDNSSSYSPGGELLLHDDQGGQQSATFAPIAGGLFDAVSVDMKGFQRLYLTGTNRPGPNDPTNFGPATKLSFNNFQWNGYRNGVQVASDTGSLSGGSIVSYLFGKAFSGLSALELRLMAPGIGHTITMAGLFFPNAPNQAYCLDYCGSVSIDNLALRTIPPASVPLPSGLVLFLSALIMAAFVSRRRVLATTR